MSAPYPVRKEPITCPTCGKAATLLVRDDGKPSEFLSGAAFEGVRCQYCEDRDAARLDAVHAVRFPGPGPRSPTHDAARNLMRQVEHLVADEADPTLPPEVRTAAKEMLEGTLPVDIEKIRTLKMASAKRSASALRSNATRKGKSADYEKRVRSLILQAERDEDGKRRGSRAIKTDLEKVGLTVSRERIQALRLVKR